MMHGPLRIGGVGLVAGCPSGTYTGRGTVSISGVTSVIITAEPTVQAHMPILPPLTMLASTDHRM
jgi:hypothetical protein